MDAVTQYEIRFRGLIDPNRQRWFEGWEIVPLENGETMLRGIINDQPALFGVLSRIRDLGLELIEVKKMEIKDG